MLLVLVMGGYAYLDGELHVRLSIAMVAIMDGVIKGRDAAGYKSAGVAFLYVASYRVAGGERGRVKLHVQRSLTRRIRCLCLVLQVLPHGCVCAAT